MQRNISYVFYRLMLACYQGHVDIVKLLRKFGAKYDDYDRGGSYPIHWAVDGGHVKLLDWIIADGADVNQKDLNSGWTPLIRCGKGDFYEALLGFMLISPS